MLRQTCEAFGIKKTRTTAYHPQGDGLVERANRSIIQMLRTYCCSKEDWEQWLPLLLYAYRTSVHSSTKLSPFTLMFGHGPISCSPLSQDQRAHDTSTYLELNHKRLAEMYEIVDANQTQAGEQQKRSYDKNTKSRPPFHIGDAVWLSVPTKHKLDSKWE